MVRQQQVIELIHRVIVVFAAAVEFLGVGTLPLLGLQLVQVATVAVVLVGHWVIISTWFGFLLFYIKVRKVRICYWTSQLCQYVRIRQKSMLPQYTLPFAPVRNTYLNRL